MSDTKQEITRLIQRVREGDQAAARELLDRYGPTLVKVIRRRLAPQLRSEFDSDDFVQSVWGSFFAGPVQNYHFESEKALMAFLVDLACNKVSDAARGRFLTLKRNVNRTHSLEGSAALQAQKVAAPLPTPSQVVMAEEVWDRILQDQPPHYRNMLALLRQGYTHEEVALRLGFNEKTVRRVVRRALSLVQPETLS